jgi:hypothetical protein
MNTKKILVLYWPFKKDEQATLYWLSSPVRIPKTGSMIHAYFESNGEIRKVIVPWGTLPFLSLGSFYSNGLRDITKQTKPNGHFTASDITSSSLIKAYDAIPRGLYPLSVCDTRAGFERCQVLKHRDGRTLVFPCISIIQELLCPSVFLANRILTSSGLDDLSDQEYVDIDGTFHIDLTIDYPQSLLTKFHIIHFCWIKGSKLLREAWNRVFVSLTNTFVETLFPLCNDEKITYYGLSSGKTNLVLHFEVNNPSYPYKKITVNHPLLSYGLNKSGNHKHVHVNQDDDDNSLIINASDRASSGQPQKVSNPIQEVINFLDLPEVEKRSENLREVVKAQVLRDLNLPAPQYTTQDSGEGLPARPIEIDTNSTLAVQPLLAPDGLEFFYEAIDILRSTSQFGEITVDNYPLPAQKVFASATSCQERTYSVARIKLNDIKSIYVIEVSHANSWSLSTLVFSGRGNPDEMRDKIIACLLQNSGHWNKEQLSKLEHLKFRTIKHFESRSAMRFAELILLAVY